MPKKADELRTEKLNLRVSPRELALLSEAARREDLPRMTWLRRVRRREARQVLGLPLIDPQAGCGRLMTQP